MHRYLRALCALVGLWLIGAEASATLREYSFSATSGRAGSMDNAQTLWQGSTGSRDSRDVNNVVTGINLPFSFRFDGVDYSRISVSSNGLVGFGDNDVTASGDNSLTGYDTYPVLAPWWDQLALTGGAIDYCSANPNVSWAVSGTEPNRVVVVQWEDVETADRTAAFSTFQVRLYEGTNIVEFYYDDMTSVPCRSRSGDDWYSTSATIGIAVNSGDFISVIPDYDFARGERESVENGIDMGYDGHRIPAGTIYRFAPCNVGLTGDPSQGGTDAMSSGDVLFSEIAVERGSSGSFQPFTIENVMEGCGDRSFRMSITGTNASDYVLDMYDGTLGRGERALPTITFSPSGPGTRRATLTITDDNNFSRTFTLAGVAGPRIDWIPNVADGGTSGLADGDSLLRGIIVPRTTSRDFRPMTIENFSRNVDAPGARVTLSIDSAGLPSTQYQIIGASTATLAAGERFVPVIRFTGTGVGRQLARLTVNADDEVRTYTLAAISGAPAISVTANGIAVDADNPAMNLSTTCVGEVASTVPFVVTNSGTMPLTVDEIAYYLTDTTDRQGTPRFPLLRDARGNVMTILDYSISDVPGGHGAPAHLPFTLAGGESRTMYLTFVGREPGRRFGRVFLRTNAENVFGIDTTAATPTETLGLFTTDLTARAFGSQIASNAGGLRLRPVVFPHTRVGDSSFVAFTVANAGACALRINKNKLRVASGDVNEFRMVSALANASFDQATGDYILAPGQVDTIRLRFTPSRAGTRLATVWIQTNDSTVFRPGLAERGSHYLDLHGRGLAGLDGSDVVLAPVVIGSSVTGAAVLENSLTVAVGVDRIFFDGGDVAEFAADNWPTTPTMVLPGQKISLGVRLTPTGLAGVRRTTLVVVTTTNDTVRIPVRGEAGVQTLVVSPTSLFANVTIPSGQIRRQSVMIANDGTLPVRITKIEITGADASSYVLGTMPRLDLVAGQTEYLEVTFAPTASGPTSAELVITASNGQTYTVLLGGTALRTHGGPIDPTTTTLPGRGSDPIALPGIGRTPGEAPLGDRPTLR